MKLTLTVPGDGLRADAFLAEAVADLSRSAAQKLMEAGAVTCNGRALSKSEKLSAGAVVEVDLPSPSPWMPSRRTSLWTLSTRMTMWWS